MRMLNASDTVTGKMLSDAYNNLCSALPPSMYWARNITSDRFIIYSVAFYPLCDPGESLQGNIGQGCALINNFYSKNVIKTAIITI